MNRDWEPSLKVSWGFSSDGRAFVWQTKGHGFDPRRLHQDNGTVKLIGLSILTVNQILRGEVRVLTGPPN